MNDNQSTQIERPNTPLPPPISDDDSSPTPTTANFDNQLGVSPGIASSANTNQQGNTTASTAPRTVYVLQILENKNLSIL